MDDCSQIHHALAAIANNAESGAWILGGSAGLLLRGLPLVEAPNDIDIYCDREDVTGLHEGLKEFAVDAPEYSETKLYKSWLSHYVIDDVRVELVGGFQVASEGCRYLTKVKGLLIPYSGKAEVSASSSAKEIPIVPLAHELWFNRMRDRMDRVSVICEAFAAQPWMHEAALRAVEADEANHFTATIAGELHQWLKAPGEGEGAWRRK
ncbi:hypothetical protein [Paenibacillus sp. HB172176]|uniref:hypothetical protein n=1 Tax=Paenibacillus sp. HB172176 TaxID=2493690 RepID=UPI0014389060|nr:hypothetical protein [Paenibacillus sp. HB172176]